ncbi:MAG TPA: 5'/3'-nucleotidase SurE [Candidatus Hydrogenedens sp.]|nr:5'/3'-nucleotidase SurE [Candidatus Hydrogenedens sp.]HOK10369.1 5'/3'-nucleotidase SurE [Candidatus Hydrogenedens sp.]HOL20694.1 5'/3'-nucleotidase SurE [Candidatus Hydrogenedens sp.]HPP59868.1 5'/3'-nucleotidase SurE [Candidatus Hydrogenedens sp.]
MSRPVILLTNDDGIHAKGLSLLADVMESTGDVYVFAPDREQSAVGHSVSLRKPLRVTKIKERWHMVDGTPTDCIMLAVRDLLGTRPSLIIAGINAGANLGDDVTYSGTVAGAFEGMLLGIPSFSISVVSHNPENFESAGIFAVKLARYILKYGIPADTMLNVNVPDLPYSEIKGVAVTRMGRRNYQDEIIKRYDPRGQIYYWIGGAQPTHVQEPGTDFDAIEQNQISITPLQRDFTNHSALSYFYDPRIEL